MKTIEEAAKEYSLSVPLPCPTYSQYDQVMKQEFAERNFDAGVEFAQRWILVEEELPKSQKKVIVKIKLNNGSEIETTAIYIAPKTVLASDFLDDYATETLTEYDEEIDDYWAKEGWFEWHYYTEINYLIHDKIIGWRPIELK